MKRLLYYISLLSLLFVACGKTGNNGNDDVRSFSHLPLVQQIDTLCWMVENYQFYRSYKCYAIIDWLEQETDKLGENEIQRKVKVYSLIGNFYQQCYNYQLAIDYFKQILQFPFDIRYFYQYMGAQNNIGCAYVGLNQPDSAAVYFKKIIDEKQGEEEPQYKDFKVIAQTNLARIYVERGEYAKTVPYFQKAIEYMYVREPYSDFYKNAAISLVNVYLKMDEKAMAKQVIDQWLATSGRHNQAEYYKMLFNYHWALNNYHTALACRDSAEIYAVKERETYNVSELLHYTQKNKNIENQLLNLEKERNRNYFFFALGGILLLSVLIVLIFINRQKIRRKNIALVAQIRELQELQQIKEDELLQKNTFETPETDAAELCPESRKDKICIALRDLLLKDKIYRNETLSRDSLTKKLGINRHNLEDAFLFCFSMHFSEYIIELRLRDAVVMLEASDVPIIEISEKVGFGTLRTFQRQFTAKYNISPKDYRALAKKK